MSLHSRIRNLFRPDVLNREIDDELQSHLDEAVEAGRDPAEDCRARITAVGSKQLAAEESRWEAVTSAVNRVLRTV